MIAGGLKTQHLSKSSARLLDSDLDCEALISGSTDKEHVAKVAAKITQRYHLSPTTILKLKLHMILFLLKFK